MIWLTASGSGFWRPFVSVMTWVGLCLAVALGLYLVAALLVPEHFE